MKKIDSYVIKSFLPPFLAAFLIAIFVLFMQAVWLYIDDIVGKGLGFFVIMELLAYKIVGLVPLALPIAVLISSVMVMGNFGERYELSSLNSAGVPLMRIMRPLIFFGFFAALVSYLCADYVIPEANLKFGSRMYDISKQKPTLRLDAGVFNYDFKGFAIHIGKKGSDGKSIEDVIIYDHSYKSKGQFTQIVAKEGEMYTIETPEGQYFVMSLRDGCQYVETRPKRAVGPQRDYPFIRSEFKTWERLFDLSEFDLSRTDEQMFRHNRSMMSSARLQDGIDSITHKINLREVTFSNYLSTYFNFIDLDSTFMEKEEEVVQAQPLRSTVSNKINSNKDQPVTMALNKEGEPVSQRRGGRPVAQDIKRMHETNSFILGFKKIERSRLLNKAKAFSRSIKNRALADKHYLKDTKVSRVKFTYDMHAKYSMAVVCIIFIFIGAPMGAIVRKGGFGYPILIAIIFFVLFVVMLIFFRQLGESFFYPAAFGPWIPCFIMFPIGLFLTFKAMNNARVHLGLDLSGIKKFINRFQKQRV